jgi:hypothetical protein
MSQFPERKKEKVFFSLQKVFPFNILGSIIHAAKAAMVARAGKAVKGN